MTDADAELAAWLANGEMAAHNTDKRPSRGPGRRAVTVEEIDTRGDGGQFRYEHDLQVALFRWADTAARDMPELEMLFAVPNGGHRYKSVAAKLKAEGVKAGVLDVFLDVPSGGYHGLRIELKVGRNTPTDEQQQWIEKFDRYGYKTAVCYDLQSVQTLIVEYLSSDHPRPL